ncbi:MAG TPA: hypothetical protein VLX92_20450 [Kofleriaceae bacterium]|nr:hypothetical protein [Kofleriaceae bacterium]
MKVIVLVVVCGCTTLGPMPATTGLPAVPAARPGVELQAGLVPGFMLSSATTPNPEAGPIPQLSGLLEPDRWFGIPGLVLGARTFGRDGDDYVEPFVGYRRAASRALAWSAIGYGSSGRATDQLASYHAVRAGGELTIDERLFVPDDPRDDTGWLQAHVAASLAATAIAASGRYCVDPDGNGTDCQSGPGASNVVVDGSVRGVYPAATATFALDLHHMPAGVTDARLGLLGTVGYLPRVIDGVQRPGSAWGTLGVTLQLGFGEPR